MPKKEAPLQQLAYYLPDNTYNAVADYLQHYKVHLTVSRDRKTLLGDYRQKNGAEAHRISVNGNLNKYAFLITLVHELAHLTAFEKYGKRIAAHGPEWKKEFSLLLHPFVQSGAFPDDIKVGLQKSLTNAAASSCADVPLQRVLHRYDAKKENELLVEKVPEGARFATPDGRKFVKGPRLRTRFRCEEVGTKRVYLFSPVYAVRLVE